MPQNYVGKHRPKSCSDIIWAERNATARDYEARWFGYSHEAKHSDWIVKSEETA